MAFFYYDMNHQAFYLEFAFQQDEAGAEDFVAVLLGDAFPDDGVGVAGFVFDRHKKNTLGGARVLADQD